MSEIPQFILRGVEVLNEFLTLIHHPSHFQFTPEFLRRVKMSEETIEDREQLVDLILNRLSHYIEIDSTRMSRKSAHELLCFLCSVIIESHLWTIFCFKREFASQWSNFRHLLAPYSIFAMSDLELQLPKPSTEVSLETVSAIVTKYALLQNKLKKLKMLQATQIKLLKENQLLLHEINDRSLNSQQIFLQNMMDGVQIIPPSSTASTTYSNELASLKNFENIIEAEKGVEDLFWRWIRKKGGNTPSLTEPTDVSSLDSEIVEAKGKLNELVRSIEDDVLMGLFKQKIDISKQLSKLRTNDRSTYNNNKCKADTSFPAQEKFNQQLITSLLDIREVHDDSDECSANTANKIEDSLMQLRSHSFQTTSQFIEVSNQTSPFECIIHQEKPLTF